MGFVAFRIFFYTYAVNYRVIPIFIFIPTTYKRTLMRYLVLLSFLSFFSCASWKNKDNAAATGSGNLKGTAWVLARIPGFSPEPTAKPVTLDFSDTSGRFGGNAGCNMYGGLFEVNQATLKFSQVISTKMACVQGMETEYKLLKVLEETDNYVVEQEKLKLKKADQVLAEFSKGGKP